MKYTVRIYFSGFVTKEIEADSKSEAIIKGRKEINESLTCKQESLSYLPDIQEIIETLEPWREADTAETD